MGAAHRAIELFLLPEQLAIIRLPVDAPLPSWACASAFYSVTRTRDELSIVCARQNIPKDIPCDIQWRAFKARGPFPLSEIGILSALAVPLAAANVSLFAISTFDTDYLLVNSEQLQQAMAALRRVGHTVRDHEAGV
jgi:hypothetical protein